MTGLQHQLQGLYRIIHGHEQGVLHDIGFAAFVIRFEQMGMPTMDEPAPRCLALRPR